MSEKIGEAYVEIRGETSGMESDISGSFGRLSTMAAGLGITAGVGLAKLGSDLETSLMPVGTLVGTNSAQFKELTASMKGFMEGSPMSPDEIGNAAYMTLSAGITNTKDVMNTLTASQQLAQAGLGNLAGANDLVTSAMNSFTKEGLTADEAAKLFYGTIASGKTTTDALAQGFGSIAPLAAGAGVGFKDLMAATASLTATGQPASVAYSALRGALTSIIKPSAEAAETAADLGLNFSQAHLASVGLPAFLNEVAFATGGNVETMGKLFGSVEGLNAVMTLTGPQAESFAKNLTGVATAGENMADRAAEVGDTTANKMKEMVNNAKVHLGELAQKLTEFLIPKFEMVQQWVTDHWPEIQRVMQDVGEVISQIVGFLADEVMPRIVTAVQWVVDWVRDNWPAIQDHVMAVFEWINTNVVPVVTQIATYLAEQFGTFVAWVQEIWPTVSDTITAAMHIVRDIIQAVVTVISTIWDMWGQNIVNVVVTYFGYVRTTVENVINFVRELISTVMALIRGDWGDAWEGIKGMVSAIWDQIVNIVSTIGAILGQVVSAVWSGIKAGASLAWDGIKALASAAWDGMVDYVKSVPGKFLGFVGDLGDAALKLGEAIVEGIGKGLKGLGDALLWPFKKAWNAVADLWNSGVGSLNISIPSWVPGVGGNSFDMPSLPKFHKGGRVPGGPGDEMLAVLEGGEQVLTRDQQGRSVTAISIGVAHFADELDMESVGRQATSILAGLGVAA